MSVPAARGALIVLASTLAAVVVQGPAWAQSSKSSKGRGSDQIYTCVDSKGRKLTSDRPMIECLDREHRVLNRDGSMKTVLPPSMTAEERAVLEDAQRRKRVEEEQRKETIRHDRNLLARFPNRSAHDKARESALDNLSASIKLSEKRLDQLRKDLKPLNDEAEFYVGKELPGRLRAQFDYVQVATEAQNTLLQNQQAEMVRINTRYDEELVRLEKLWAGAQPGSVGSVPLADGR
jgi:hypothetical protein